ncbi:MAG: hypothetical protein D6788_08790 [Planctomycetota bacterium]|nr:MAG: hypothetical protein D6788_08790 [Planctomycetota bacterium]
MKNGDAQTETARYSMIVLIGLLCFLFGVGPPGKDGRMPAQALSSQRQHVEKQSYARTPDEIIPYRRFHRPYVRFFQSLMPFRGAGREENPVERPASVRIGVLRPTGSAADADIGQTMLEGIRLAVDQANAEGGYEGMPFELLTRSDAGPWGSSANEMVAFKEDGAVAVIGSIDGASSHVALRVALKIHMPMVNTATTDPTLTETNVPWIARCMADDRQQGYALAHYIFEECGIQKVVAFRVNDRFGRTGIAEFRDAARRLKHPLRLELRWERGDRDFTPQLRRIAAARVDAVVIWGNAADAAAVVRMMRKRHMTQRIFGCDRLVSERFLHEAGEAAEGVVAVASFYPDPSAPAYADFRRAFLARFGHEPDAFAAHGYDGANLLMNAIRTAGLNRVRIRDALYGVKTFTGATGVVEFDTTMNDIGPVYLAEVREGEFVYSPASFTYASPTERHRQSPETPDPVYRRMTAAPDAGRLPGNVRTIRTETRRIGCLLPMDEAGRSAVCGLKMALAEERRSYPDRKPVELFVEDLRHPWGQDTAALTRLVAQEGVVALIGSTELQGTRLMETMAARMRLPLVTLCENDSTIHAVPLPWVFSIGAGGSQMDSNFIKRFRRRYRKDPDRHAALGYDAARLILRALREGDATRLAVRNRLANGAWFYGASGVFRFDALGRRVNREPVLGSEKGDKWHLHRQGENTFGGTVGTPVE